MAIWKEPFGVTAEGQQTSLFTLENRHGHRAVISDYGCTVLQLWVPDRTGVLRDVVLGYDTLAEYERNGEYLGACLGRFGGWIRGSETTLNGAPLRLAANQGPHHLHGGPKGFDRHVWNSRVEGDILILSRLSPDGEEGYPGDLSVTARYAFTDDDELILDYEACCDRDTLCNLSNHSYFNLEGGPVSVEDHVLQLQSVRMQECREDGITSLTPFPVAGTAFDFQIPKPVGRDLRQDRIQLRNGQGYDHNYYLGGSGVMKRFARLQAPGSGIVMEASTTQPGVQVYTANTLDGHPGKGGLPMPPFCALCLETQFCPSEEDLSRGILQPVLKAGERYAHRTVYRFSAE